jgi:starch-binding outer membrane protein, SusD/RagB family
MKKYKLLTAIVATCFLFACNKQLDLPTDGRITIDQVFSDYNRTRGYLNSCYGFCPAPYMDRASFTDEAQDGDDVTPGSRYSNWYGGNITSLTYSSYSADGSPWGSLYTGIRKCNVFLESIKTATVYASEAEKGTWIAQALTLRALYYLQLIKRYGGVPIFDKPLEINHDFASDKRATFSEVVKFILADCDKALAIQDGLSWNVFDNQYGIMTRAVAYAIKSQSVTYAASPLWSDGTYTWAMATDINKEALSQCLLNGGYKLFDVVPATNIAQNPYALYFFTSSNDQRAVDKETIYQSGAQMQIWKYAGMPTNSGMEKSGPCPTQDLVDSYEMANGEAPITGYSDANKLVPIVNSLSGYDQANPYNGRDPRFYASIYYNGSVRFLDQPTGKLVESFIGGTDEISDINRKNTRTGYYLRKYNNYKSKLNNDADGAVRLFRLAELYLNFAESAYQSAGPDVAITATGFSMSARDAVSAVRARVGMPAFPIGMSKDAFEKKYRNERRIELAFEEHRFFDVRRWKILDQTDKFVTGMRITKTGSVLNYNRFKFPDRNCSSTKYLMYPIDQSEVDKIIGLSGVNWQNPGWMD